MVKQPDETEGHFSLARMLPLMTKEKDAKRWEGTDGRRQDYFNDNNNCKAIHLKENLSLTWKKVQVFTYLSLTLRLRRREKFPSLNRRTAH